MIIAWRGLTLSLGRPGFLGLVLLALAAALSWGVVPAWQARRGQLLDEAAPLQRQLRLRQAGVSPVSAGELTSAQWQLALPAGSLRQQRLAALLAVTQQQGLASPHTEHRLTVDEGAGLERLRVTMPVQASYRQLRAAIGAALAQDTALSLDSLKLRRTGPLAAEVEAELVWSLHGRAEARPVSKEPR